MKTNLKKLLYSGVTLMSLGVLADVHLLQVQRRLQVQQQLVRQV